jgi:phage shock protein A
MSLPARKVERVNSIESRVSVLEAHYQHIRTDVQALRDDVKGIRQEVKELAAKFDMKFGELQKALESMRVGRVWDRVWMLISMGALLSVMARAFKWI